MRRTLLAGAAGLVLSGPAYGAGASGSGKGGTTSTSTAGTTATTATTNGTPSGVSAPPGPNSPGTLGTSVPPNSRAARLAYAVHPGPSQELQDGLARLRATKQGSVQQAQVAVQNASNPEVKQLAQDIATSAQRTDSSIAAMAHDAGMNTDGPAFQEQQKVEQAALTQTQAETGKGFDQSFTTNVERDGTDTVATMRRLAERARLEDQSQLASFLNQTASADEARLADARRLSTGGPATGTGAGTQP
jgi:putative membrane protein